MAFFCNGGFYGDLTKAVYERIRDNSFDDAKEILQTELQFQPDSRALLSLLAYCQYSTEEFELAAEIYAKLSSLCPNNIEYIIAQAQSLFKYGEYEESLRILESLSEENAESQQLRLAIAYQLDDLKTYRSLVDAYEADEVQSLINRGCLLTKSGNHYEARRVFMEALELSGFQVDLAYNCAVCCYELEEMGPALQYLSAILDYCTKEFPELQTGTSSFHGVKKIKNSRVLKESYLIETLNLKAAIEFRLRNFTGAKNSLTAMPPREDSDLDPVTLYNSALLGYEEDPESSFEKLKHLLLNPPFPKETVETLLVLYCQPQHRSFNLAADLLAEHPELITQFVQPDVQKFVEAMILRDTEPERCLEKLNKLCDKHLMLLRKEKRQLEDSGVSTEYKTELENYISTLMAAANVHYEQGHFTLVEKLLLTSVEFCAEHPTWRTNLGHTCFVQGTKFEEAIANYESILRSHENNLLGITAVILANLCASYIMTNQNHLAEEIMRNVELEESEAVSEGLHEHPVHLCIIDLVIGTLYCSKGNFDFGISRVMKSFEPYEAKLDMHTWHYAKKCMVSLLDALAKHFVQLNDERIVQIMQFLQEIEHFGSNLPTESENKSIGQEARMLKNQFTLIFEHYSVHLE